MPILRDARHAEPRSGDASPTKESRYARLPDPSDLELPKVPFRDAPSWMLIRGAMGVRKALHSLIDAIFPAELAVFDHATGIGRSHVIAAVAKHKIADLLERKPLTAEEIAQETGLAHDPVHRTLRALASVGFFKLSRDGRFSNTRLSRALMSGRLMRGREFALYYASGSSAAAWGDFARTLEHGGAGFDRMHQMTVWDWYEKHADEREMFAHVMMGITVQDAPAIAKLYPFSEVRTLCDVGGGRGTMLSELVLRHPHLKGILADSPGLRESAEKLLSSRGVSQRVEVRPSNFFESVPSGADAYLLKNIMHDWDDEHCVQILKTVRQAATTGTKLLLCETLVAKHSSDPMGTMADLHMMTHCSNGRERDEAELFALMEKAGFARGRVFRYPTISVVEGVAK